MKTINHIVFIVILLTFFGQAQLARAEEIKVKTFAEQFDFYFLPGSALDLFPCIIDDQPCEYTEAVPIGQKPLYERAIYIGTGKIDLNRLVDDKNAVNGYRLTIYRVMSLELDKGLAKGLALIEQLLAPGQGACLQGPEFDSFSQKLQKTINAEETKSGTTANVVKGWKILKLLGCPK